MTAFERETLRYLGNAKADERLMALIASVEAELRQEVRPRGLHRRLPDGLGCLGLWPSQRPRLRKEQITQVIQGRGFYAQRGGGGRGH